MNFLDSNTVIDENQEKISIPYNERNKSIKKEDVKNIISKFNVVISAEKMEVYQRALTHKSYVKKDVLTPEILKISKSMIVENVVELQDKSNERLEFLGDTVIKLIVSNYLFQRYYYEDEGFMTRLKTKIENRKSLAHLARIIGIDDFLLISKQIEKNIGRTSDKILEDAFESFIGALFLDSGFQVCNDFITNILESEIDYADLLYKDTNYKDQLLRYYHKNKWNHPEYVEISHEGPPHKRIFTMGVTDSVGAVIGIGIDSSKRKAEQTAAKKALIHFNLLNDDQMTEDDIMIA